MQNIKILSISLSLYMLITISLMFLDGARYSLLLLPIVVIFFWMIYKENKKAIGDLKRNRADLRQAERHLRFTIDNFPFPVWMKDHESRLLIVNRPFARSCNKDISEIEGKIDLDVWSKAMAEKYRTDDQSVMKSKQQKIVTGHIDDDGHDTWFETYKSPVYDDQGAVCGTVGFSMNVSERQKYEDELRLTSVVFDSSYEGIMITDNKAGILKVNAAFTKITGYSQEDAYLKNPSLLASGHTSKAFYKTIWETLQGSGSWSGEIWNKTKEGELYLEWLTIRAVYDPYDKITNYVGVFTDISVIKESKQKLNYLAFHDHLTGLGNRALLKEQFEEHVHLAQEDQLKIALLFIDLDGFKSVNDDFDHDTGDKVLQIVAKRLQSMTRVDDLIIRLGGDEFVVLVIEVAEKQTSKVIAKKMIAKLSEPYNIDDQRIHIGASIGISTYPDHGTTIERLMQNADKAMYAAKKSGKGRSHLAD